MPYVTRADLDRLLMAAESDQSFTRCEKCGAWMFDDEAGAATVGDDFGTRVDGCWWSVLGREKDRATCFAARRGGVISSNHET